MNSASFIEAARYLKPDGRKRRLMAEQRPSQITEVLAYLDGLT
jgi:hypothetical protein